MSGFNTTLLLAVLAMALRTGLFYAGIRVAPFDFIPLHLLLIVLAVYFSGHFLLRQDASRGFGELLRTGFQSVFAYAFLISVFSWFFYRHIDAAAFTTYNAKLVQGFVEQGFPVEDARQKVGALYNATSYAALTFFGSFLVGSINAFAFAALHHKVLRRFRK
ncbi:MAG: hypothetical protein JSS84_00315 [Bacteroidetes bacterium]|nr:hypothetical protein [Bacteroidota bacterium]